MVIGILGAMASEVDAATRLLGAGTLIRIGPHLFTQATYAGHELLIGESGVGKVNAALAAQALLQRGVDAIIFTGVAGGVQPGLEPGALVFSTSAVQHDVDVTALGYLPGEIPGTGRFFAASDELLSLAQRAAAAIGEEAHCGVVASADMFVASPSRVRELHEQFGAACTEMEGAAVAQAAHAWGVPFLIVRALSDSADGEAEVDFRTFTEFAADRSAKLVAALLTRLPKN